jgi:hypothetical protein
MPTRKFSQFWLLVICFGIPLAAGQNAAHFDRRLDQRRVEELLRQLDSDESAEREFASAAILELGIAVRPFVASFTKQGPLEVRRRCEQLLRRIDLAEFERQAHNYRMGGKLESNSLLPCAEEFCAFFGGDDAARSLYCDALVYDRFLLQSLEEFLSHARKLDFHALDFEQRTRLSHQARPLFDLLGELSAAESTLITVETPSGERISRPSGFRAETLAICAMIGTRSEFAQESELHELLFEFFRDSNLQSARKSKHLSALRVGAAKWLAAFEGRPQSLSIAMRLGIGELALKLGRKAIDRYSKDRVGDFDDDGRDDLTQATLGIVACGKFGDESDLSRLGRFLDERLLLRTWITDGHETYTCELRDLALVYSAHLAKIDPKMLGFPHLEASAETVFAPFSISFADKAQRENAHANWRRLRTEVQKKSAAATTKSV